VAKKTKKNAARKSKNADAPAARRSAPAAGTRKKPATANPKPARKTPETKTRDPKSAAKTRNPAKNALTKKWKNARSPTAAKTSRGPTPVPIQEELPQLVPPEKLRKTRLSPEKLDQFKELLLVKRRELAGTVNQLRDEALHKSRQDAAGDLSSMPIHMADLGSDNWEQEFTLGLVASENELLREIDDALQRIEDRTYGICLATNKPIQRTRLRAKPWAKYCIEYARELELKKGY